ncbi:RidA family protein [Actinobacteria bacterium YIM 96077]|uniref:RidA family protein n=1 Tax=Phytoactinopolyspora halophila TaxID=1981511 RepID=A0A329QM28_9ACTN|nr:RidA family protein [Phytoactinopolyspora halophila]AYY12615.1 RidA family protein [Actinobacteria bacterium YIM 96077]RAW12482.1 RidA family protein [Phytoactinopolyspora halophila]
MTLTHLNPESLHRSPVFSQGVQVEGAGRLVVVGGQNGVDATGAVVGTDLGTQSVQALRNVLAVLGEAGAAQENVIRLTVYLVGPADATAAYAAAQEVWGAHPTAVTVLQVAGLARPDCLVEVEALAHVPSGS